MKTFEYRGFNQSGQLARGLIEALDLKEAREKLSHRGILAEKIDVAGHRKTARFRWKSKSFGLEARAMVYQELGALLRAGLPLTQCLHVLIDTPELGENRTLLAGIRDRIREGGSLAESLMAAPEGITPFEEAVIQVGEKSGTLQDAMEQLAGYLEEQRAIQDRVSTAMIYPAIVLALALGMAVLMLGVMVPRMEAMLQDSDMVLPLLTRMMLGASHLVGVLLFPTLVCGVIGVTMWRRTVRENRAVSLWVNRRLFGLPLISRAYTALVNLRFATALGLLLKGGVPLLEGMILAGRATGSCWISDMMDRESDAVRHGKSLADAVRTVPPLQGSLPSWVEAGEASGDLIGMLESAASRYQQQWDRSIARMLAALEPTLILAIGLFVLLVALSILLPVLSLNQGLI